LSIWKTAPNLDDINRFTADNLAAHLDIRIVDIGADYLKASMPVDQRTHQPMGILHGGASVALAETVGSIAAQLCVEPGEYCVGLDINANHVRSVRSGTVYGVARPAHIGRSTQVWEIRITDDADRLVCLSRLTMAVLKA
jgi:1,4-dihydroxy-2-naphthoyl-CoA hydrolase